MKRLLKFSALLVGIALAGTAIVRGNTSTTTTEKVEGTEWNVTVCKSVSFNDSLTGVNTDAIYTVADTATINQKLLGVKPENLTIDWTIPSADGKIWLVAYENEPILNEKVKVTEANSIPSYDGDIQVVFKFADAKKWETITQENIDKRLALLVNGQLISAPQVNTEITSGSCSVSIPADRIHEYLPDLDLKKLKQ